ncbi:hypothetical protein JCM10212_006423 [Sporobolomyces blumeae]
MSSTDSNDRILPKGSLILVTGANGKARTINLEEPGYRVRGTARSLDKLSNLQKRWDAKYPGMFQAVEIPDLTKEGCYDEALKDVGGFAHAAADVTFSTDFDAVVGGLISSTLNAFRAASSFPNVKSFVLTSSYIAAAPPQTGKDGCHFDGKSWNDQAVVMAKSLPADHPAKGFAIYMASKCEGEKALWKWVEEEKPSFSVNTVLPGVCVGEVMDPEKQWGSTGGIIRDVFLSKTNEIAKNTPVQAFVAASDIGVIHLGALVLSNVTGQRFYGTPSLMTWNDVLAIFRSLYPSHKFFDDFDKRKKEDSTYDDANSRDVLRRMGRDGWKTMEEAMRENVEPVADQLK